MTTRAQTRVLVLHPEARARAFFERVLRTAGFDAHCLNASPKSVPSLDNADVVVVEGTLAMSYGWFRSRDATALPRHLVMTSPSRSLRDAVATRVSGTIAEPASAELIVKAVSETIGESAAAALNPIEVPVEIENVGIVPTRREPDHERNAKFFDIAERVARAVRAPMALVTFVDHAKQTFLAQVGLPLDLAVANGTLREWSFCQHAVRDAAPLIVTDAEDDPRFAGNALVEMKLVRAYAGVPIRIEGGSPTGTVCVISDTPRTFSDSDLAVIDMAATACSSLIAMREKGEDDESMPSSQVGVVPEVGTLLDGKYWVTAALGEGGQGNVLLARDRLVGQLVAIKMMQDVPNAEAALLSEARALASVRHTNLVTLHGWGRTSRGRLYVVLDFVDGDTLERRMGENPNGERVPFVIKTLHELGGALATMHGARLLHGDVKPANVIVDRELDRCVLIDLGLGVSFDADRSKLTGFGGGTPGYSAPEQYTRDRLAPTADVYGLAATTYAMLAGRGPFEDHDEPNRFAAQIGGAVQPLIRYRPDLSSEVEAVLTRALSIDPAARPATVLEFVDTLVRAFDGRRSGPPSRPTDFPRSSGRVFRLWREALQARLGVSGEALIVVTLPEGIREVIESATIDDEWYDADAFVAYLQATSGGNVENLRLIGTDIIVGLLPHILGLLNVARTMPTVVRVLPDIARKLHDWLEIETTSVDPNTMRVVMRMPVRFAPTVCQVYLSGARALATSTNVRVDSVEEVSCYARGDDRCEALVRWSARIRGGDTEEPPRENP